MILKTQYFVDIGHFLMSPATLSFLNNKISLLFSIFQNTSFILLNLKKFSSRIIAKVFLASSFYQMYLLMSIVNLHVLVHYYMSSIPYHMLKTLSEMSVLCICELLISLSDLRTTINSRHFYDVTGFSKYEWHTKGRKWDCI